MKARIVNQKSCLHEQKHAPSKVISTLAMKFFVMMLEQDLYAITSSHAVIKVNKDSALRTPSWNIFEN